MGSRNLGCFDMQKFLPRCDRRGAGADVKGQYADPQRVSTRVGQPLTGATRRKLYRWKPGNPFPGFPASAASGIARATAQGSRRGCRNGGGKAPKSGVEERRPLFFFVL